MPIVNYFLTLSVYIIVWLSYDRWLAVCNPHKFPTKQRLQVVHKRFLATIVITFLMYVPSPMKQTYQCIRINNSIGQINEAAHCCVFESKFMEEKWFYIYEFLREIYSRFLPGILITSFNVAIIVTLRMVSRKKMKQARHSKIAITETHTHATDTTISSTKQVDTFASTHVCNRIDGVTLNCCSVPNSPEQFDRIELGKMSCKCSSSGKEDEVLRNTGTSSNNSSELKDGLNKILIFSERSISSVENSCTENDSRSGSRSKARARGLDASEARNDREMCLVLLLLGITVSFYASSFPSALYKIMHNESEEDKKAHAVFRAIADVLEVSGHVFNFCLYFLLSPEFRRTLFTSLPFISRFQSVSHSI